MTPTGTTAGAEKVGPAAGRSLADRHDALLVDLDGTLVLAGHPIPEAAASLKAAAARGAHPVIVTNNASRSPREVADSLSGLGFAFTAADVVSSPQAAAAMLSDTHPAGSRVLVVGTEALCEAITDAGLTPVRTADQAPVAVVQGHSPDTCWRDLAEACIAIRGGADWVATNADTTLPTDRGLLPGNGSMVAALVAATGTRPRVAGKPARPLLDAAAVRAGASAPLVVGDRLDTDIAASCAAGMPSLFVLTGVSTARDLIAAGPDRRPTWVSADLRGLVDPARAASLDGREPAPGWVATVRDEVVALDSDGPAPGAAGAAEAEPDPVAALAATVRAAWASGITEVRAGDDRAAAALRALGLLD
jgi:HAD superfamily hydrolase (TIGR01450 family)